jgi:small subunit ribosomal protein S6
MRYDASSKAHLEMRNTINLDPRIVRTAHVKVGNNKLETMAKYGAIKWDIRDA